MFSTVTTRPPSGWTLRWSALRSPGSPSASRCKSPCLARFPSYGCGGLRGDAGETPGKASASGQEAPGSFVKLGSLLPQSLQPDVLAPAPSPPWCSPRALCDPTCQASSTASGKSLQPSSLCSHLENGAKTVPCVLGSSGGHTVHRPYWGLTLPRLSPSVCVCLLPARPHALASQGHTHPPPPASAPPL